MRSQLYRPPDDAQVRAIAGRHLASFPRRAAALLIDLSIAAASFIGLTVGFGLLLTRWGLLTLTSDVNLRFTFFENWYSVIWLVLYFTLSLYFLDGRTIGKLVCRIRVVSIVHPDLSFWHCLERALGYGASALEAGFGFFQYFLRPDRRTVHDRIAETVVLLESGARSGQGRKKPS